MYKAVLVDDEPWALAGLRKIFRWHEQQFEIAGATTNPVEALDLIQRGKPDAVFTDIRMPELSGIELMKLIRAKGQSTEFIIISGFADFSYAQRALRLGAFDYCLKPLQLKEADTLLNSLWRYLEEKNHDRQDRQKKPDENITGEYINPDFMKLLDYVNSHYPQELKLCELAKTFHLNSTYCSELFRKTTRKSYSEYLSELRIGEARRLLDSTCMALEQIAQRVGINDYYYFSKVFKKITGLPPLKYRKEKLCGEGESEKNYD